MRIQLEHTACVKPLEGGIFLVSPLPEELKDVIISYSNLKMVDGQLSFDYQLFTLMNFQGKKMLVDFEPPTEYLQKQMLEMVKLCGDDLFKLIQECANERRIQGTDN